MLPVGSSGGDTFILFNKGLICFYNQYKCEGTSKRLDWRILQRTKTKRQNIKILAFFQKKRKAKPHHLQKAKLIWEQNTGGTVSLDLGVSPQFLTCQRRPSHSNFSKTMINYIVLKQEISHRWKQLRLAQSAGFCLFTVPPEDSSCCFPLTDWVLFEGVKSEPKKCVQSLQCERQWRSCQVRG